MKQKNTITVRVAPEKGFKNYEFCETYVGALMNTKVKQTRHDRWNTIRASNCRI